MPELQLLKLLATAFRARLARVRSAPREAGSQVLEALAMMVILVTTASLVLLIIKSKAEQSATRITLP